jgi:hypothetical protein
MVGFKFVFAYWTDSKVLCIHLKYFPLMLE